MMRVLFTVVATLLVFVHGAPESPLTSPTPCPRNFVCPEPRPYDLAQSPETGDVPPVGQFKSRIGWSIGDPNFAFCYYNKFGHSLCFRYSSLSTSACRTRARSLVRLEGIYWKVG